jgi:hypothetical protein
MRQVVEEQKTDAVSELWLSKCSDIAVLPPMRHGASYNANSATC